MGRPLHSGVLPFPSLHLAPPDPARPRPPTPRRQLHCNATNGITTPIWASIPASPAPCRSELVDALGRTVCPGVVGRDGAGRMARPAPPPATLPHTTPHYPTLPHTTPQPARGGQAARHLGPSSRSTRAGRLALRGQLPPPLPHSLPFPSSSSRLRVPFRTRPPQAAAILALEGWDITQSCDYFTPILEGNMVARSFYPGGKG